MLNKIFKTRNAFFMLTAMMGFSENIFAQFTYPGCADVSATDFTVVTLASNATDPSLQEPIKMALDKNAQGNVDVYFTQRYGQLRKFDGTTHALTTLLNLGYGADSIDATNSEGMIGVALDPAFKTNNWLYLFIGIQNTWRVSRFTLADGKINPNSERNILRIATSGSRKHVAGALRFDQDGNLWLTVADNENKQLAANPNSLNGKILRIRPRSFPDNQSPTPGNGSTYDIPKGNLFPEGTVKILPEIYVMGVRNPYSIAIDSVRKAIAWGDVGPDNFSGSSTNAAEFTEEHNFTTKPGNFGWPFWAGNNIELDAGGGTPQNPANGLPPAIPAINPFARAAAITGPIYYFDPSSASPIKFPPHFDGTWFVGDLNKSWVDAVSLNSAGTVILGKQRIIPENKGLTNPLDMLMGTDGALYVVNYAGYRTTSTRTGIMRVEYHGLCHPATRMAKSSQHGRAQLQGMSLIFIGEEAFQCKVFDPSGRLEFSRIIKGEKKLDLAVLLAKGLHLVTVTTSSNSFSVKLIR
jgi:cytochrome c